ncbi:MAG: adenine deaminase C-terminal domain-containing protein [Pseudoclavibacter sp.]
MSQRAELFPTTRELGHLRATAAGRHRPDLVIRGGRVLSPGTREWLEADVLVTGRHIAALTPWGHVADTAGEIDARGAFIAPLFIDAHLHIEYTSLTPGELARLSVPRGTGTVLTDPNGAANVWGARGMDYLLRTRTPLRIFQQVSPTTPTSRDLELGGAVIDEAVVHGRLRDDSTVTLGEGNPFDHGEVSTDRYRAALAAGRRITGHTASQSMESLWGYVAAGVSDDHNASTIDEALERTRAGMMVTIMGSSLADNTGAIFADLDRIRPSFGSLCFCADDKHALDLAHEGHIDHHVRRAIALGVDPLDAYRMATMQPAAYYRLDQLLGTVAPSRLADLQVIPALAEARPSVVVSAGRVVARDGRALFENRDERPAWTSGTVRLSGRLDSRMLRVAVPEAGDGPVLVRAMEMFDGYFKRRVEVPLTVRDGGVVADPEHDVLKIAVVDRHHGTASAGVGFVRGFGLRRGAIATSMNAPNINTAVVGADDASMLRALEATREMDGGLVVVDPDAVDGGDAVGDGVVARVPLPVGGMMSDAPFEDTVDRFDAAHGAAAALGCEIRSPFMILSFVGLYTVPDSGITERGLIDAASQSFIDVLVPGPADRCGGAGEHPGVTSDGDVTSVGDAGAEHHAIGASA